VLYSLHRAKESGRKHGRVVLVEGYMDVIGAWSAGVAEAVAPCGTALTAPQVRLLKRYAPVAVVNFDPDAAGANATERSIQLLLDEGFRVRVATLDNGLDPDEYVKKHGASAYRERLENAQPYFHWLAGRARGRFDVKTSEGKVQALEFLLPRVREVRDRVERASLATELASVLGVEQGLLLEQFRRAAAGRTDEKLEAPPISLPPAEKVLLEIVLANAAARALVIPRIAGNSYFEESLAAELWTALAAMREFSWEALEKQLSPAGLTLMASLAFADHQGSEQLLLEQTESCLQKLAMGDKKAAIADLKRQIRAAEASGQIMEALRLAEELNRLQRSQ
jgi:DNA primase